MDTLHHGNPYLGIQTQAGSLEQYENFAREYIRGEIGDAASAYWDSWYYDEEVKAKYTIWPYCTGG